MRRLVLAVLFIAPLLHARERQDFETKIDAVFAAYAKADSPGCAVGVARGGDIIFEQGYGMANLEYDVPLTASSIFEAGSVSKQFTAAAVLLLAEDGKLSLDDPVRKYVPELDDSASGVTIRNLLNHTSGLRDWGTIVGISGWRRGTRQFSHPLVLDVISKQRALNFAPGTQWSYSNSGYNLAAMIVERVSGKSFPDFTRDRIFTPLGMTHSSWRDNFARVVKGRATAYDPEEKTYVSDMDTENIYGNCCLLTTVGDLLRWNENFATAKVGNRKMLETMQTPAVLANGQRLDYAFGLFVNDSEGKREVYHSGATAGWRAFLTRRLYDGLSIAVLCNRGDASAGSFVEKVASVFTPAVPPPPPGTTKAATGLDGLYRDFANDAIVRIISKDDGVHLALRKTGNGPLLVPITETRYKLGRFNEVRFESDGVHLITAHKPAATYTRVADAEPAAGRLGEYAGIYVTDEAAATYVIAVDGNALTARVTPVLTSKLEPTYADGFMTEGGTLIRFTRNRDGVVDGADVKADFAFTEGSARVERLHFTKR